MAAIEEIQTKKGTSYRFIVRMQDPDGRLVRRKKNFPNKTLGRRWAKATETAIKGGTYEDPRRTARSRSMSLRQLLDAIADELWTGTKTWHKEYRKMADWWSERIGSTLLVDLTADLIRDHLTALKNGDGFSGEPVAESTVRQYYLPLSRAIRLAIKREWMTNNPLQAIDPPAKSTEREVEPLTDEERELLVKVCYQINPKLGDLVVLSLASGGRQNELIHLKWRHVDFKRARIRLMTTKGGKPRSVPVPAAMEMLRRKGQGKHKPDDCVVGWAKFYDEVWQKAKAEAAKVFDRFEDFHFHDLRHVAASYMAMSGASLPMLVEYLGHKHISQVLRYAHFAEGSLDHIAARAAQRFLAWNQVGNGRTIKLRRQPTFRFTRLIGPTYASSTG